MERKLKRYSIDPDQLLGGYLRRYRDWPNCILVAESVGPPDGSVIEEIWFNQNSRCFVVMVSHDSFDVVKDNWEIPSADDMMKIELRVLVRGLDGSYRLSDPNRQSADECNVGLNLQGMSTENLTRMRDDINALLYDRASNRP